MPYLTRKEREKLIPLQQRREQIKFGNGVSHKEGRAIFLPRRRFDGESLADIIGFVSRNADTIKNIGGVASNIAGTMGSIAGNVLDVVKKARELNRQGIDNKALEKVLDAKKEEPTTKTGNGFYDLSD